MASLAISTYSWYFGSDCWAGSSYCCYSIFFFSSRRRHTRCGRDWSSDVCSSDLLGMALTVKVGHAVGTGSAEEARRVAFYGISFALLVSLLMAAFMWLSAPGVVLLYSENTEVQLLAAALIQLAVLYQISDALQVNAAGALRGYKDTRVVMLITLFSYWLVGLGGGWW